jgi:membrane protein required for colicin V production
MALDALGLGLLALFVALGAWRGALATGLSVGTLVVCYVFSSWAAFALGARAAASFGVPALLGPAVAGTVVFVSLFVTCALGGALLRRRDREQRQGRGRSLADRLGGAAFGAVRGGILVLLLGWLAQWVDALGQMQVAPPPAAARPAGVAEGSALGALAQRAVEAAVAAALGDASPGGKVAARLLARPAQSLPELQSLVADRRFVELAGDQEFWARVEDGDAASAMNRLSFLSLAHDESLRARLAAVGLVSEEVAASDEAFARSVQAVLEAAGPRLRGLRDGPELRRLAEDPEVARLLERRDVAGLLVHPGFRSVVARVLAEGEPAAQPLTGEPMAGRTR